MMSLDAVFVASSVAAAISCVWAVVSSWVTFSKRAFAEDRATKWEYVQSLPIGLFIFSAVVTISIANIQVSNVRAQILASIQSFDSKARVTVNGDLYRDSSSLISALKLIRPYAAHHSSPTRSIKIAINDAGKVLSLNLRRDSEFHREYWIFYDGSRITRLNEIGRVTTTLLDDY